MKLTDLTEMTMTNTFPQTDDSVKYLFDYLEQHGTHIGD